MKYIKLYEGYTTKNGGYILDPKEQIVYASMEGDIEHVKKNDS